MYECISDWPTQREIPRTSRSGAVVRRGGDMMIGHVERFREMILLLFTEFIHGKLFNAFLVEL